RPPIPSGRTITGCMKCAARCVTASTDRGCGPATTRILPLSAPLRAPIAFIPACHKGVTLRLCRKSALTAGRHGRISHLRTSRPNARRIDLGGSLKMADTPQTAPAVKPANPNFSSGPCAKRPGWTVEALTNALVGRSHRSKPGKARIQRAIDLTLELLEVPADYRIGIVPASDTGAVEMAMWSMLGERGVDMLAWESFGEGWVTDVAKQLKLEDVRIIKAPYG